MIRMLYRVLSKRLGKYMCDAWDAEECDAVDRYVGTLVCVERYKSRSRCSRMFRILLCKRWLGFLSQDVE